MRLCVYIEVYTEKRERYSTRALSLQTNNMDVIPPSPMERYRSYRESYEMRIATFIDWPKDTAHKTAIDLAQNYFIYIGDLNQEKSDRCMCVACGIHISCWKSHDWIERYHLKNCPCYRKTCNYSMDLLTSNGHYTSTERRLDSFDDYWEQQDCSQYVSAFQLAENGMYCCRYKDIVRCFYCGEEWSEWEEGDDPAQLHKEANCAWFFQEIVFAKTREAKYRKKLQQQQQEQERKAHITALSTASAAVNDAVEQQQSLSRESALSALQHVENLIVFNMSQRRLLKHEQKQIEEDDLDVLDKVEYYQKSITEVEKIIHSLTNRQKFLRQRAQVKDSYCELQEKVQHYQEEIQKDADQYLQDSLELEVLPVDDGLLDEMLVTKINKLVEEKEAKAAAAAMKKKREEEYAAKKEEDKKEEKPIDVDAEEEYDDYRYDDEQTIPKELW